MAEHTAIEWTEHTFNPWTGCQAVSPGCDHCYAEALDKRFGHGDRWGPHGVRVRTTDSYWKHPPLHNCQQGRQSMAAVDKGRSGIDWVIVGGESGPRARPMHPAWASELLDQCDTANVPCFFKQWGEWKPGSDFMGDAKAVAYDGRVIEPDQESIQAADREAPVREPTMMRRVGKKAAGALLDGFPHREFPRT